MRQIGCTCTAFEACAHSAAFASVAKACSCPCLSSVSGSGTDSCTSSSVGWLSEVCCSAACCANDAFRLHNPQPPSLKRHLVQPSAVALHAWQPVGLLRHLEQPRTSALGCLSFLDACSFLSFFPLCFGLPWALLGAALVEGASAALWRCFGCLALLGAA